MVIILGLPALTVRKSSQPKWSNSRSRLIPRTVGYRFWGQPLTVINQRTVLADIADFTVTIDGRGGTFNNQDTLAGTPNGGKLNASGSEYFQTTTGSGTIVVRSSALNLGVGATSGVEFIAQRNGTISGDVAAAQTLWIQGGQAGFDTTLTAAQGFTNAGTLRLESIDHARASNLTVTTGALTNTGTITVGAGSLGARTMTTELINSGTVNVGTSLTLGRSAADHMNSGTFTITSPSAVVTFTTASSTLTNASTGTIAGVGTLIVGGVPFTNNGTVGPGLSAGQLNVTGNYTQGAGGTFAAEIGGLTAATEFDRLNVSGQAILAGTLDITVIDPFAPSLDDTFVILTAGSVTGTFPTVTGLDTGGGLRFDVSYGATSVTLTVVPTP